MRTFEALRGSCMAVGVSLLLALTGCGSSSKSATTTAAPATTAGTTSSAVKAATYNVNLTHVSGAGGAANASGVVVLSVKPSSDELCWSISPIKSFTVTTGTAKPTIVTVQPTPSGTPSTPGIPLGTAYKASGCTHVPPAFLSRFEAHPQTFYLSIYNTESGDAVRGQV
jgi:hypothetical protein